MAPRSINSWVADLHGPPKSSYADDEDVVTTSASRGEASAEREQHAAKARAALEGNSLSSRDSGADVGDSWKIDDDEDSDDENPFVERDARDLKANVAPEPFRSKQSNTTEPFGLHRITSPEWDQETQIWSTKMQPSESIVDLQKTSTSKATSGRSCPSSTSERLSGAWTLTPSDAPYRPTWLVDRDPKKAAEPAESEAESSNAQRTTSESTAIGRSDSGVESRTNELFRQPQSFYQSNGIRDTLRPNDSISRRGSPEPTQEPSRRGPGGVRVGDRISYPPQLPPTLHASPRTSRDPLPRYVDSGPSRDIEMQPIYSVPMEKLPEESKPEEPLNGRTAWLHALAGFLVVFNCWGITNSFGLYQGYYEQYYLPGTSASSIAWIGSTQLCLVFGLGVPIGRLVDKGYFRVVFYSGSFVICVGILSTSWCTSMPTLWLTQGLLTGLGMGMVFCSGLVGLLSWFDEKHIGMAMGVCAVGSCVGGIVYVLVARSLLLTQGFGTTMRILSAIVLVTLIPANIIFRVRGQKNKDSRRGHHTSRVVGPSPQTSRQTFTEPAYLLLGAGMFFSFLGVYFGFVYIVTYGAQVLQMSNTAATNVLVFMLLANIPGRILPALISDKCIGPLNTIIPLLFLSSMVVWIWAASTPNKAELTVIAYFYGFVSGGVQVLYAPTMHSFCLVRRSLDEGGGEELVMDRIGVRAGGISTCIGLACLAGTPIGGALISARMDKGLGKPFLGAQLFAGACLLIGGLLLLGSRVAKAGWKATRV